MLAAELVRTARKRADLSQDELAARAGTTQSAIARLEAGGSSPRLEHVAELVAACGLEFRVAIAEPFVAPDTSGPPLLMPALDTFLDHRVSFIVTGWFAAALRGSSGSLHPRLSACPDGARANLQALCRALDALGARLRTPDGTGTLPLDRTPEELMARKTWQLATAEGELDVVLEPPGTRGYRDLVREATPVMFGDIEVPTASLPDAIREIEASGADPDLVHALRRLLR